MLTLSMSSASLSCSRFGELLLRARLNARRRGHGVGERLDGVTGSVDASADLDQLFGVGICDARWSRFWRGSPLPCGLSRTPFRRLRGREPILPMASAPRWKPASEVGSRSTVWCEFFEDQGQLAANPLDIALRGEFALPSSEPTRGSTFSTTSGRRGPAYPRRGGKTRVSTSHQGRAEEERQERAIKGDLQLVGHSSQIRHKPVEFLFTMGKTSLIALSAFESPQPSQ